MFKKSRDVIGDVFKGIIIVIAVISGISSIWGVGSCVFSNDATSVMWSIIVFFGSLFAFWLISSVSKIVVYLDDIRQSQYIIAQYYTQYYNTEDYPQYYGTEDNIQNFTEAVYTYTENQTQ